MSVKDGNKEGSDNPQDREFPVTGIPNNTGEGFVDYVLWDDDGKPLGLVEANGTRDFSRGRDSRPIVFDHARILREYFIFKKFDHRPKR